MQELLDIQNDKEKIKLMMQMFSVIQSKVSFKTDIAKNLHVKIVEGIEQIIKPSVLENYNDLKKLESELLEKCKS